MKRRAGEFHRRLKIAEDIGYARGFADKHCEKRTFTTGAEYIAWLRGWRKGQVVLRKKRDADALELATAERVMRRLLGSAA